MFGSHIYTFTIIEGSGDFSLKGGIILKDYKYTIGNAEHWYVPGKYYISQYLKDLLKLPPFPGSSQRKNYLMSRLMQLR